jgi:hypothetical protein
VNDFGLMANESKVVYKNRVNKAIENLEQHKNSTTLSISEFSPEPK